MGLFSSKKISLPALPEFFVDPYVEKSAGSLYGQGQTLTSPTLDALPPILREAASTNPEITRLTLEGLRSQLDPSLRQSRQDIINQLEANNQLTGSTTASSLGNLESDYLSQLTSAGANAAIADINRALTNRINIYNMGLNAFQGSGEIGLQNQSQRNQFNLANYENEVAAALAGQKQSRGGLIGALTGGLGGLLAGGGFNPLGIAGGIAGAISGGLGPSGTGGSFLTAGAGIAGSGGLGGARIAAPRINYNAGAYTPYTIQSGGEAISDKINLVNPFRYAGIYGGLN